MLGARIGYTMFILGLLSATASCVNPPQAETSTPESVAELYAVVEDARTTHVETQNDGGAAVDATTTAQASLRSPLPGRSARTVLHEELNEAENLFFTEDGRLFVSGAEDIYEIKRAANGAFTKTDHFHEDCVVEGIVRNRDYLYGLCWTLELDLSVRSFLIGGELTQEPVFRILGDLDTDVVANGMTVDPQGRIYITYTTSVGQVVRLTFAAPLQLERKEIWASNLPNVNGIKYLDGAVYVTLLNETLSSQFARIPMLPDGRAGVPETLFERWLTVFDDVLPFDDGFIITDFLTGTLIFWDRARGAYAETPARTFYGPTSVARGRPPMFTERELIVAEKGNFLVRDERRGDLLSVYRLP